MATSQTFSEEPCAPACLDDSVRRLRVGYETINHLASELRRSQEQWMTQAKDMFTKAQDLPFESKIMGPPEKDRTMGCSTSSFRNVQSGMLISLSSAPAIGHQQDIASTTSLASVLQSVENARLQSVEEDEKKYRIHARKRSVLNPVYAPSPEAADDAEMDIMQPVNSLRLICKGIEASKCFTVFVALAICSNVVVTGLEVEYLATHSDLRGKSDVFDITQAMYAIVFSFEMLVRIIANGKDFFMSHSDWYWNGFDLFVVGSAVVEAMYLNTTDMSHFRMVRVFRITKLFRTVRIVKMIRALKSLVLSIAMSLRYIMWSFLLLFMIVYSFAVAFVQAVVDHCSRSRNKHISHLVASGCVDRDLEKYWGTLPRAMLTLFESVTNGVSWTDAARLLGRISPVWLAMFPIYVSITAFAVLNVVTAMFCQSTMEGVQQDKEHATMQLMADKNAHMENLNQLFSDIDEDQSGIITIDEFERALERKPVRAYLESLGIASKEAWQLFKLLDSDTSGVIDKDEFMMGCIQFRGGAKAVEIAKMAYEFKVANITIEKYMKSVDNHMNLLGASVNAIMAYCDGTAPKSWATVAQASVSEKPLLNTSTSRLLTRRDWHSQSIPSTPPDMEPPEKISE